MSLPRSSFGFLIGIFALTISSFLLYNSWVMKSCTDEVNEIIALNNIATYIGKNFEKNKHIYNKYNNFQIDNVKTLKIDNFAKDDFNTNRIGNIVYSIVFHGKANDNSKLIGRALVGQCGVIELWFPYIDDGRLWF